MIKIDFRVDLVQNVVRTIDSRIGKEAVISNTLNITSKSEDPRARRLSNFSPDAFVLDGQSLASVEGFIQGTKFPDEDPRRTQAFQAVGIVAKRFGEGAARQHAWWQGEVIPYGSAKHHQLIERAIRAKFDQTPDALEALLATEGLVLTHDLGEPEPSNTSLPALVFCDILTRIREENLLGEGTT